MIHPAARRCLMVLVMLLSAGMAPFGAGAQEAPATRDSWPTNGWRSAPPEERGMDAGLLAQVEPRVQAELPLLSGLVVVRGGDIVYEQYANGQTADQPIHLWSTTKSVTSMAIGMAIDEGLLRLDQTLGELIPERIPAGADPRTANVTVENLLTMTSGWEWDSGTDFMHLDDAPDWAARTLGLPMACDPGTCYEYNSGNAHLASVVLQQVTGQTEADFLQSRLFDPLGIVRPTWRQSPQGETAGAFGLELNPRAVAKLGYLYLNQGVWDGQQIVPTEWVATSTMLHSSGTSPSGINLGQAGYGYFWWVTEVAGYPAYFALGYGSQVIYVVPALDLVAVAMVAAPNVEIQQNSIPLIQELIVPAALAGPAVPEMNGSAAAQAPTAQAPTAQAPTAQAPTAPQAEAQVTTVPHVVAAATPISGGRVFALPGERIFPEGIAYDPETGDFYVGSIIDGTIFRGNVVSGEVEVFLPGRPGLVATGLTLDGRGRLYVAGGQTGFVAVYDIASRERIVDLGNGLAPNTFLNDVAVTPDGHAYFTDSFNPILFRLPASALPAGMATPDAGATPVPAAVPDDALDVFLDLSAAPSSSFGEGFNATGIVATPDGRSLLVVQNNTGSLYQIDVASGDVNPVALGGAALTGGGGLALDGQTLYVVTGETITVVEMASGFLSGTVGESFGDPTFASPTSIAGFDGCLLVVNSQIDRLEAEPVLPFTISSIPIPVADTPVAAGRC